MKLFKRHKSPDDKPFSFAVWGKMLPYTKPYNKKLIGIIVTMLLCAIVDVCIPLILSYAVDHFIVPGTTENLVPFVILTTLVVLLQGATVVWFVRMAMRVELGMSRDLRRDLFSRLQTLSFSYYNKTPVGYLIARIMSDTARIGDVIAWGLVDLLWSIAYIFGVFISMFILNWKLALIVLAVVPPLALLTVFFQNRILRVNRRVRHINSKITGAFNEGISGARTSKTLVIEEQNTREFGGVTHDMYRESRKIAMLGAMFWPTLMFLGSVSTALVLSSGGVLFMKGIIEYGVLAAFINYTTGIFEPIEQLARVFSDFVSTQANIERVTELLERTPDITDRADVVLKYGDCFHPRQENWEHIKGDIEFQDVTFRYPDGTENVLEHFSLNVPAGTYVAIVGETGAGKSTLVNLVCRFFEPTEGRILIDGCDYRERSQLWLHSKIGYVLQNPHLFSGTVRDNIRYGRLDATDEEIEEAARLVSADKVILKLEQGMDSVVGEGGDRLSTGEKQLISFARAVLADPRIFILDEATSSVDTETEQLIQRAIADMLRGRTAFIIAHRLSTIRMADVILYVKDGVIAEQGTHEQLMQARGLYYELYTRQVSADVQKKILDRHAQAEI